MNGGVSLAVWMGGVALEIDNVRRASLGLPGPSSSEPNAGGDPALELFELWKKVCHERDISIVVDVIAGTSAGGLNGVLLAGAIAHGAPLDGLRQLWLEDGQLSSEALLKPEIGGSLSVLNGDFFFTGISGALEGLSKAATNGKADVALTTTATALGGDPRTARDGFGRTFEEADHRRRYEFRRVSGGLAYHGVPGAFKPVERDDFAVVATLAEAARASASYPGAFAPVLESPALKERRTWPTWSTGETTEWLADGGILDNSPFQPVLQAIADQPVDETWLRTLCFIAPSADETTPSGGVSASIPRSGTLPPPWTSVVAAALALPGEIDFRDDIEEMHGLIRAHRTTSDIDYFKKLIASPVALSEGCEAASALLEPYRRSQADALVYCVRDAVAAPEAYVDPFIPVDPSLLVDGPHPWLPEEFPSTMPETWAWGTAAAGRTVSLMLRSLSTDGSVPDELRALLSTAGQRITAIQAALQSELISFDPELGAPPTEVEIAKQADVAYSSLAVPSALWSEMSEAIGAYAESKLSDGRLALAVLQAALSVEVVNGVGGSSAQSAPPLFDYLRMGISQPPRLFAQTVAEVGVDQKGQSSQRPAADILYGTRLAHFAAFGKKEWRRWDWLWGRIHAAVNIGRLLDLPMDQVDAIVTRIVLSEGFTVDAVDERIALVMNATAEDLISAMRAEGIPAILLDSVFEVLESSGRSTNPPLPSPVRKIGGWLAAVGSRNRPAHLGALKSVVRALATLPRWLVWRRLRRKP